MAAPTTIECEDFLEFQDMLKKMRVLDDKIIYSLNTSIPTESFKNQVDSVNTCKQLYSQLRLLSAELNVEEIIRERTNKVYYERCRPFYKPPNIIL
ncbi:hypothetical protein B566_EDAN003688 [Ephemera danica]|nr:hypothetical protein B566_EDAN003688 [Ephemera danica]